MPAVLPLLHFTILRLTRFCHIAVELGLKFATQFRPKISYSMKNNMQATSISEIVSKSSRLGLAVGIVTAVAVSLFFTTWDWIANPGGVFRDAGATKWSVIYDTAASWFWPILIWVTLLVFTTRLIMLLLIRRKK